MQRRLTGLGFDTKVTGTFDESTRAVITRWQAARGYPKSGYLNKLQHKALLTEIVRHDLGQHPSDEESLPRVAAPAAAAAAASSGAASTTAAAADPRGRPSSAASWAACWAARSVADRPT